jgi:SMODS-associating 4TM effector domain
VLGLVGVAAVAPGTTERVEVSSLGVPPDGSSGRRTQPALNRGWRVIAFDFRASNSSGRPQMGAARWSSTVDRPGRPSPSTWLGTAPGLYQMSWNTAFVGQPVPPEDLHSLVRAFQKSDRREDRIRDWYPDTTGLYRPYDILLCQQTNLAWDARLRRRYAVFLLTAVILWSVLGVVVAIVVGLTVIDALLRWYVPSLAALRLGLEGQHAQREVANERERLLELVRAELDHATPGPVPSARQTRLIKLCREIQDGIFATRRQVARVPGWFYERFRPGDEDDMYQSAEQHRIRLRGSG